MLRNKRTLLLSFVLAVFLTACSNTTTIVVVTATPSVETETETPVSTVSVSTPTQEVATPAPTATKFVNDCRDPLYSNSECPINESLFAPPCSAIRSGGLVEGGFTFEHPRLFFPRFYEERYIPNAKCVLGEFTLDILPRNEYIARLEIDVAWWRGRIVLNNTLSREVETDTCYIVRVPLTMDTHESVDPGDVGIWLELWDRDAEMYRESYPVGVPKGDIDALFMVQPSRTEAPIYQVNLEVMWSKFVTGNTLSIYSVEWYEADCNDDAIRF